MALSCVMFGTTALCSEAIIGNRITDREVVNYSSLLGRQTQVTMHLFIVESTDTRRTEPERFRGQVQTVAYGSCLEMHVTITAVTMSTRGPIEIADHRERHACVASQVLPQAEASGGNALVATREVLQPGALRGESVNTGLQPAHAMHVQIKLNETPGRKIT